MNAPTGDVEIAPYDISQTTPFDDVVALFRSPRAFFESLGRQPNPIAGWVILKALLGHFLISWLVAFVRSADDLKRGAQSLVPLIDEYGVQFQERFSVFGAGGFSPDDMKQGLASALAAGAQAAMVAAPFFSLMLIAFTALTASWFLPMVGVSRARVAPTGRIVLVGIFANWFMLLELLPVGGRFVAVIVEMTMFSLGVAWIHRTSFVRSFLALYVLSWVVLGILVAAFAALMIALFTSVLGGS